MNNRYRRVKDSFMRAHLVLSKRPLSPEPPMLAKARVDMARVIEELDAAGVRQLLAAQAIKGAPSRERALRQRIRMELMKPLVRLAKTLRKFAPGVEGALVIPHKRSDSATVAAACERLVKALKPHAKLLVSAGYSRTHLAEVGAEARMLARMAGAADRARKERTRETAAVARLIKEGQRQVAIADAILMAHLKDAVALSTWQGSRRVGERIGRPLERTRRKRMRGEESASASASPPA